METRSPPVAPLPAGLPYQPDAANAERLRQAALAPTERRLLILEVAASLPADQRNAVSVLREIYSRGIYIPLPSVYRILREMKRRGLVPATEDRA